MTIMTDLPKLPCFQCGKGSDGQASVFVVVTIAVILLASLLLYDTGRLSLTRMHLQNTADSAAYSGAVVLARAYNFSSYANRAMVANQVAVAQMVGLASWSRYYCLIYTDADCGAFPGDGTAEEIQTMLELMSGGQPGVDFLDIYTTATGTLFDTLNTALPVAVDALNLIIEGESAASTAYYLATMANLAAGAADGGIIGSVVQANDPQAKISTFGMGTIAASTASAALFTKIYKPDAYNPLDKAFPSPLGKADPGDSGHVNTRFHDVVTNSLDSFSQGRSSLEVPPFSSMLISTGDCFGDGLGFMLVNDLGYHGSTSLTQDNSTWTAKDVNNGYLGSGICVITIDILGVPIPIPIPLIIPAPTSTPGQAYTGRQASASAAGITPPALDNPVGTYSGLAPYLGVADITKPDMSSPAITLFVDRPESSIMTTQGLQQSGTMQIAGGSNGQSGTSINLADNEAGSQMQVGAAADAYFARPASQLLLGGSQVYGNMFNPYWEAHLVPVGTAVKLAAAGVQAALP